MLIAQDTGSLARQLVPIGLQADGLTDRPESVLEEKSTCWGLLHDLLELTFSQQVALLEFCFHGELFNEKITDSPQYYCWLLPVQSRTKVISQV